MDAIEIAKLIEERYRRYLSTTFYFKDPELRKSFEDALSSGHLSKGPYLEATAVFKRGQTPRLLFPELLESKLDEGLLNALDGERLLYKHQEEAIQKVHLGRNVVVATGTGSGKTEAFLYPTLLHLYSEFQRSELCPGVRALILYPMNALANDQRERLGKICERLQQENSPFRFSFGQYIGETPEDENDSRRRARDFLANAFPGESVLRSEMRKTPPHILLTNYSMLEYLLLRPDDSPLFDNGNARWWRFLVLDEAHQYRGSRGIEMAMLLRRLKERLREGGCTEPFHCIATSATLVGEKKERQSVADFAMELFGEKFLSEDIILGTTEPIPEPTTTQLILEDYDVLKKVIHENKREQDGHLRELTIRLKLQSYEYEEPAKIVSRILQYDSRANKLRSRITGNPIQVNELAGEIFKDLPKEKQIAALSELVDLLLQAQDPDSGSPLLSARYHFFLRSLEGAFVSYWPVKKVFLDRKVTDSNQTAFEVALCRECGQHYFVGKNIKKEGKLEEAIRDPNQVEFGAAFFRPIENDSDENEEDEDGKLQNKNLFAFCVQCGEIEKHNPECGHNASILVVREDSPKDEDRADQMAKCGACGYHASGRDPVREVIHGTDGPHAVIATTLYQTLPDARKKILAFADGRQEAAFFAWYLENSYRDILTRNLILKIIRSFAQPPSEGTSLSTVADKAFHDNRSAFKTKESDDEPTIRKNIWAALYRELLTEEHRISLEGAGLIRWSIKWPDWIKIPAVLKNNPWSLSESETWDLLFLLFDSMRTDRAIELQTDNNVYLNWGDLGLQASPTRCRIGAPRGQQGVRSWDGKRGKRAQLLAKILRTFTNELTEDEALEYAVYTLREIWEELKRFEENTPLSRNRLLLQIEDSRKLNPDWWRMIFTATDDTIYQCDTCGRLQSVSVRNLCARPRCLGTLTEKILKDLEANHYRLLYEEQLPGSPRVEEHTAQLDKEKAREFQREFREGKIHVLSCSTTFELGVDLGTLDTIFLRNVPPEAFNYTQRVGRAGRRIGYPGFAITFCRRNPHDLYHYVQPERMLSGKVRPPVLSVRNEKIIIRHIAAIALSTFFRARSERFDSVESLFKDLTHPTAVEDLKTFLLNNHVELEKSLRVIVSLGMHAQVGLEDGSWIDKIIGSGSLKLKFQVIIRS